MRSYSNVVLSDATGLSVVGAEITVLQTGTALLATIWPSDSTDGDPMPNPFRTDPAGTFLFYAADGRYDVAVRFGARTSRLVRDIELVDALSYVHRLQAVEDGEPGAIGSLRSDLSLDAGPVAKVKPERSAGAPMRLDDMFKFGIRLTAFGALFDGVTDDTQAWRDAIAFVAARKVREIIVPEGLSIVSGQICNGKLPMGTKFVGEGKPGNEYVIGSRLRYTGAGVCFALDYSGYTPPESGLIEFENISFHASNGGTMFEVNGMRATVDGSGDSYVKFISFYGCYALGSGGDFFRGSKVFSLYVDDQSNMRGWRRAFWLRGCDNCRIDARLVSNGRHIMQERSGFFGNNLIIGSRYLGETNGYGEDQYLIWDSGYDTSIVAGALIEDGNGRTCKALMYLNGYGTIIAQPYLVNGPVFHLGPRAREVLLDMPVVSTPSAISAPIIDAAEYEAGSAAGQQDFRITVRDLCKNGQTAIRPHPRIRFVNPVLYVLPQADVARPVTVSEHGAFSRPPAITALNNYAINGFGSIGGGRTYHEADATSSTGFAIVMKPADAPGLSMRYSIGSSMPKGVYLIRYRTRFRGPLTTGIWNAITTINGEFGEALPLHSGATYQTQYLVIDMRGRAVGDAIGIEIYHGGGADQDLLIDFLDIELVGEAGWTAGTGTPARGPFAADTMYAASPAYTQAEAQAMAAGLRDTRQRMLALETAMRRQALIN